MSQPPYCDKRMTSSDPAPPAAAPPFSIVSALDRRVDSQFEEREPDGYWHPSALFGCLRQAIYAHRGTGITDPRDKRSKRILRVGHTLHEYIQAAVNDDPRVLWSFDEVKILDEDLGSRGVKGSLDQVVFIWTGPVLEAPVLTSPNELWPLLEAGLARVEIDEYKTTSEYAFKYKDMPKPDHIGQLATYLLVLVRKGGIAGDGTVIRPTEARGRIAYVSKNDLLVEEFSVFLTPGKERDIRKRIGYLDSYADDGTALPPRLPDEVKKGKTQRAFLCGYCPYATRCWELDGPGVDLLGGQTQ